MRRRGIKLSRLHLVWFYLSFGVLFLSGVFWIALHYFVSKKSGQVGIEVNPLEPFALKIHGASAMVVLVILGTLIPIHIKRAWKADINRWSGLAMISVNLLLIVTGYGLYYCGGEQSRIVISYFHWIVGCFLPLFLIWHIVIGRKGL